MDATTTMTPVRAAPLIGLRVSLGAGIAGALVTLASATMLYLLGLSIVLVVMRPDQWAGASMALWLIGVSSVLIGAAFGGLTAGWLTGAGARRIGAAHGLFSWALSFLVSLGFALMLVIGMARVVGGTVSTAVSATAQAAGGAVSGGTSVGSKAVQTLEGLGYSRGEATRMVTDAQRQIQQTLRGKSMPSGQQAGVQAQATLDDAFKYLGGTIWLFWATWLVALVLSLIFGALGATRAVQRTLPEGYREPLPREPVPPGRPTPPLTPREV